MELKYYPQRVLRKKCRPLEEVNDEVVERAWCMLEFMYESEGLGLAAPQVGWSDRIVTVDIEGSKQGERIFLNPRFIDREGNMEYEEGCLSLPGVRLDVPRAEKVTVAAYTLAGERVEFEVEGLGSAVWQHELDHLNGVLIIDKVLPTGLMSIREQLKKLEQEAAEAERY